MKWIESVSTETSQLEVIECDCGFHLGLDSTYLEQVDDLKIACPSCQKIIDTSILII